MARIAIVGASLAGLGAAEAIRSGGYDGELVVLDAGPTLPPDRPPLSKQVLAGEWEADRAAQPMAPRLADLNVDLRLGVRATGLDASARTVTTDAGVVEADGIVIATGAAPRMLPGAMPVAGVHVVRTLEDALALRADLDAGPSRVVVVGAGFIGAEVAATCRGRGLEVLLVDPMAVPMSRVFGPEVGAVFADLHRDHGVDVRLGVGLSAVEGDGRVTGVVLSDGSRVPAEVVVVGIGVAPSVDWLEGSGLTLDDGVVCDETLLAAPGIVAAGDLCRWPNPVFDGEVMRVEHWDHAIEQGVAAGRRLLAEVGVGDAEARPFGNVPWFWSDQYDRKIQAAGRTVNTDEARLVDGSFEERRFVMLYRRGDRVVGVLGVNRPRHVMQFRARIAERATWDDALAAFA